MSRGVTTGVRGIVHRVLLATLVTAFFAAPGVAGSDGLEQQVSRQDGVEVSVTPGSLTADAEVWEFQVAFDTHSGSLDGNPAQQSVLVDARGEERAALEWDGSPSGGHHRSGVLRFERPASVDGAIELRIAGVGGVGTRTFRWQR